MVEGLSGGQYEDSYEKTARLRSEAATVLRDLRQAVSLKDKDIDASNESRSNILLMEGVLESLDGEMNTLSDQIVSLKLKYKLEFDKGALAAGDVLDGYMADIMNL